MRSLVTLIALGFILFAAPLRAGAAEPRVFFKNLKDGAKVQSPLKVEMGVEGMEVAKVGSLGETEGHYHIIVDGAPLEKGTVVPSDAAHLHYGQGQTEALLVLSPGKHTLTLQFADGLHRSFGPELSATVHIEVVPAP